MVLHGKGEYLMGASEQPSIFQMGECKASLYWCLFYWPPLSYGELWSCSRQEREYVTGEARWEAGIFISSQSTVRILALLF